MGDLAATIAELLAGYPVCSCGGSRVHRPYCYRCEDSTDDHDCPPSEPCPCATRDDLPTSVRARAQAALDAIPVLRWSGSDHRPYAEAEVGAWSLESLHTQYECSWRLYLGDVLVRSGRCDAVADTLADAQRAAENALRGLGVVFRTEVGT